MQKVRVGIEWEETATYSAEILVDVPDGASVDDVREMLEKTDSGTEWFQLLMEQNSGQGCMCVYCDAVEERQLTDVRLPGTNDVSAGPAKR